MGSGAVDILDVVKGHILSKLRWGLIGDIIIKELLGILPEMLVAALPCLPGLITQASIAGGSFQLVVLPHKLEKFRTRDWMISGCKPSCLLSETLFWHHLSVASLSSVLCHVSVSSWCSCLFLAALCHAYLSEKYMLMPSHRILFLGPVQMVHSQQLALNSPESGDLLQLNPSGRKEASERALSQACY